MGPDCWTRSGCEEGLLLCRLGQVVCTSAGPVFMFVEVLRLCLARGWMEVSSEYGNARLDSDMYFVSFLKLNVSFADAGRA